MPSTCTRTHLKSVTSLFVTYQTLLGSREVSVRYVIPSSGVVGQQHEVAITGSGYGCPLFVFFGAEQAQVLAQEETWLRCLSPAGSTPGKSNGELMLLFVACSPQGPPPPSPPS
jgi:hypothetical protein